MNIDDYKKWLLFMQTNPPEVEQIKDQLSILCMFVHGLGGNKVLNPEEYKYKYLVPEVEQITKTQKELNKINANKIANFFLGNRKKKRNK